MYDKGKIITGLLVFVLVVTFPILSNIGKTTAMPQPDLNTPEINQLSQKQCVESTAYMRANHMQLLNNWRDAAVREGHAEYHSNLGATFEISLENSCLKCHSNPQKFCDSCHTYVGEKPYCWNCHVEPEGAVQ